MLLQAQLVRSQTFRRLLCFSVLHRASGGNESNEGDEGWQARRSASIKGNESREGHVYSLLLVRFV